MPVIYEGNLGTTRAKTGVFNNLQSGLNSSGSNADLNVKSDNSIILDAGRDVRVSSDLIVSGVTSLAHDPSNAFLGTRLIESQAGQDLILRPGALARVCIDGDLMLSGDIFGFDPGSNSMANTLLLDSNAVVLGTEILPDYDSIDQGGLLMRGAEYNSDPKLVSFLWNKNASGVPYWNAQGGNLRIERRLNSGVDVAFTFSIEDDYSLEVFRSIASGPPEPCIGFAPADDD